MLLGRRLDDFLDLPRLLIVGARDKESGVNLGEALANAMNNTLERASVLRAITGLSRAPIDDKLLPAITSLSNLLETRAGLEKAQALTQLSLLFGDAGLKDKSNQYNQRVQTAAGLTPQDSATVNANLLVRSDMSEAKFLHEAGLYAESEVVLLRLGSYLF